MSLFENWMSKAFNKEGKSVDAVWSVYLPKEQKIYENILSEKLTEITGTIEELSDRFDMTLEEVTAFIDGINEVLPKPYETDELDANTFIELKIDFEKLYTKMVEYKAEHLYNLPQWDNVFDEDKRKELYKQQKKSRTVINEVKAGRNDPCPCGSGKKYKKCCGA